MKLAAARQLVADRAARRAAVLLRWLDDGREQLVHAPAELSDPALAEAAADALRSDRARSVETAAGAVFVQPFNPPLRMAIVGAVHIAQHLVPMARGVGYAVSVIDPRSAFASPFSPPRPTPKRPGATTPHCGRWKSPSGWRGTAAPFSSPTSSA